MEKKIYSKSSFWVGIFFALSSFVFLVLLTLQSEDMTTGEIIKNSIFALLGLLFGFSFIRQSLKDEDTIPAKKESTEREILINFKSAKIALKIVENISLVFMFSSIILWQFNKSDTLIGAIVAFGLIFNISIFSKLFFSIYYNKKD